MIMNKTNRKYKMVICFAAFLCSVPELTTVVGAHKIQKIATEKWRHACANANSHILLSVNQKKKSYKKYQTDKKLGQTLIFC